MPSSSETSSENPNNARRSSRVPKVAVVGGTAHLLTSPTKQSRTKNHFTPESSSSSSSSGRSDNSGDNKTPSSPTTNNPGSSEGEGGTAKPWRHPAELVYVRRQDWPQDTMITYLRQNVFSVPPRDNNKIQHLFDVALPPSSSSAEEGPSEQRVLSLPKKYRVPLLFVAKFQWESLRLVLTSANPLSEWDEYKFDIVHLSRLCQHFLRAALKVKQEGGTMDKSWRCPMFDRALTRFYRKWMVSREWSVRKFWHEFAEEEYEIDVLKYDWVRWALKGHKGFLLTMDEVQHGITAEQFTTGLKKVDGAWTWDNEEWERARVLTAPADASRPEGQPTAPPKRRTKKVKSKKRSTSHMPIDVKIELLEEQGGLGLNGAADEDLGAVNRDERAGGANGSAGDADSVIDLSRTTVDPESPPAIMDGEGAREKVVVVEEEEEGEEDYEQDGESDDEEDEDEEMRDGWVATRQSSPGTAPSARYASTEPGVNENWADAMQDVRASSRSVSVEGGVNGSTPTDGTTPGITPASSFQSTPSIVLAKNPGSTSITPAPTAIPPSTSLKRVREPTPPLDDNAAEHQAKKARVESVPEIPDESESSPSKVASAPAVPSFSPAISSLTDSALTTLIKAMTADWNGSKSTAPSLLNPPTTSVSPPTTASIQPTTTSVTPMSAVTALSTFDSNTTYTPTTTTTATTTATTSTTTNQPFRSRATPNRTGTMPYGEDSSGKGTAFVSGSGTSVFEVGMGGSASSLGGGVGGSSTSLGMGVGSSSSSSSSSLGTGGPFSGNGSSSSSSLPRSSSSFLGLGPTVMSANMLGPGVGSSVGMSAGAGMPAAGAGTSLNASGGTLNALDPATSTATATASATSSGSDVQPFAALLHRMLATMTSHKANDQAQSGNVDGSSTTGMPVNALGATPMVNGSTSALTAKLAAEPTMPALSGPVPSSMQGVSREVTPSATTSVIPAPVVSTPSDLSLTPSTTLDPATTSTTNPTMVSTSSALAPTPLITSSPPTPIWGDNAQFVIAPPPLTPVKSTSIPIVARSPSPSVSSTASTPPAARTPAPAPPVVNPSVVPPMPSMASAASIFTAAAGDSSVMTTRTELHTTAGVGSSSTVTGAELSTTTGDNSSTTLVAGGISSTKPVTPAPLVPDVALPSTSAPIPSSEAPALPASRESAVSSPATTSFAPVQSQVEDGSTGSGWPSNLFSSVTSPGASTIPASIASAAPLAAHTYAGSEDMEMSDEDGPKDPVEKPTDWSMDEAPSVPTVDEETSLMDQASRLLESVIGPFVEKRTAEAPVITVPPAPVLPEVEPLKDLPVPISSSDTTPTAPDQVAVAEKGFDAPQQPIPSEPNVVTASISLLPSPEKEINPPSIEASRVPISPVVSQPSVLPTPPLPTVLTAFAPQDNLDSHSHINVTSMNVVSAWGKPPSLAKAAVIKSLLPTLDRQIMQLLTPLVSALAAAVPMAGNTPMPAAGREGVRGTPTRVTGDPWERALGIAGSMPKRRAAADPDAMDIDVQSSLLGAGAEKRETNVKSVVEARKAPREKEKQKEKETGKSTGAARKGAEAGGSGQPIRKKPRREQEEEAETNAPTFAEVQSLEALLSLLEGSRELKESVAGGKAVMETRLNGLEGLLGNLKKTLDDVGTVDADRRFGAVDEKLSGVEGKISSVELALGGIKSLLEGASKKVGELSGSLEQRLHLLEQRTQFAEGRLQIVETRPVMLTASTQTVSLPQEAGIQTDAQKEMDELDYVDLQDRDVTMADVSEAHAHRVNESLAVIREETVTKKVLSVMRNMADLLEFTKDGVVSKKGKEKEGEIEEEEPREEQEPVPDAQPQPSTEVSAISTLLEEVRAMKEELRNSEQRARDEVEAIREAHAAEVEKLKNEMLAKEKREREELEETTRRHLEEFKALKESMQEREVKQQQAAIQEQKVPQSDLIDLRRRLLYLETRNRVDNMSPDLPRSSPSSSTPPYNSIGRDSSHPLAHLFAYDAPTSPASRNAQGSPMKDAPTPTSGTPAPSYEKSHFSLRPLNGMGELDHSAPLPIKSQRKHQLMAFHRTHVE